MNNPGTPSLAARQIIVSSNCQTGGIAAALKVIFPDDRIMPIPRESFTGEEAESAFIEKLKQADVWVSAAGFGLPEKYGFTPCAQVIRIPIIRFSGFHPDLIYVKHGVTGEWITPHYNSAIAVWAYQHGLGIESAERLFHEMTFSALGYLTHWDVAIGELKRRFHDSDLEFLEFILPMRREGLFMYSVNHPKALALVRLAKLVARKMGAGPEVLDLGIDINDGLNELIWPVYPGVGDTLALNASYHWKTEGGNWINGVRAFLEYAYGNYARLNLAPDELVAVGRNDRLFDRVLSAKAGGGS